MNADDPTPTQPETLEPPRWTVCYNIVSPESDAWVGRGWEFFNKEREAEECYRRHQRLGNVPTKRPFYNPVDLEYLGAVDQKRLDAHRATVAGPRGAAQKDLVTLRQQVEDTIAVAQTDEDADGFITAYHFKTGAIHRLLAEARK